MDEGARMLPRRDDEQWKFDLHEGMRDQMCVGVISSRATGMGVL
jgi:hypothetical protein